MKALIYINRHHVRENKKNETDIPCIAIRTYKGVQYTKRVKLNKDWELIQDFKKPICSGATLWLSGQFEDLEILKEQ